MARPSFLVILLMLSMLLPGTLHSARVSDVASTKHNLSASSGNTVRATSEDEICVFCHTPHGANTDALGPLWNRTLSSSAYTMYDSGSFDAIDVQGNFAVDNSSKLCLSCHDGALSIGQVANAPGSGMGAGIAMTGVGNPVNSQGMPGGGTGFTRNLGVDLTNDHPIGLDFSSDLAAADGELRNPDDETHIAVRAPGVKPDVPLHAIGDPGQELLSCTSCHDPHITDPNVAWNIKFLRLNRFQIAPPAGGFNQASDIICIGCHDKDKQNSWLNSSHARSDVADETYTSDAATLREFPTGIRVWEASCLNCHDTHTVPGSRRLLREGTDAPGTPKDGSGNSAIEETCYQCHTTVADAVINKDANVPDIETEFGRLRTMPINDADQRGSGEVHDITDADFSEDRATMGKGNLDNRHAECTDCHNPHRVARNSLFNLQGDDTSRTHEPGSNLASGALRGSWGVEPDFTGDWLVKPDDATGFTVKKGDPAVGASTDRGAPHLTREYQLCMRCHSNYAYDDNGEYGWGQTGLNSNATDVKGIASGRPLLGSTGGSGGGTPSGVNNMGAYTNQAAEWQVRANDAGTGTDQREANAAVVNHRSWHPVTYPTGRTLTERGIGGTSPWQAPFNTGTGSLTMYCSDCHGQQGGSVEGPHGSDDNFLLKGAWREETGEGSTYANDLCFNCHVRGVYTGGDNGGNRTGFCCDESNNLHTYHDGNRADAMTWRCTLCHVAVPHGWKNKAFLVNLDDLGPEAGFATSTAAVDTSAGNSSVYYNPPYYLGAKLRVDNWVRAGSWGTGDCISQSWMENDCGGD